MRRRPASTCRPPEGPSPLIGPDPATATVLFGLVSALAWGSGDFGGGLTSRRTSVFGVALISQIVGIALAIGVAIVRAEGLPTPVDIGWSILGGVVGGIGIVSLYRGLAVGRMGIVAPVTGVLAAIIPVVAGIVLEGWPDALVMIGIGVAFVAVILVSRVAEEGGGRAGLGLALLSGTTIGLFGVFIAQISDGHVFGPLAIVRGAEALLIVGVIIATRTAWRPAPRLVPVILGIGVLDMTGNGFYILAVQSGALAVASVVSSLYPVTTVILAAVILHERVTRSHAVGIGLAVLAIVLIGVGSG
jgi:drug/metabolite transporter (DMT)-like permease